MLSNPVVLDAINEVKDHELTIATLTQPRVIERGDDWQITLPIGTRYITKNNFEFKNKQLVYETPTPGVPETHWLQLDNLITGHIPYTGQEVGEIHIAYGSCYGNSSYKDMELGKITLGEVFDILNKQNVFDTKIRQQEFDFEYVYRKTKEKAKGKAKYHQAEIVHRIDELIFRVLVYKKRDKAYRVKSCDGSFEILFNGSINQVLKHRKMDNYKHKGSLVGWLKELYRGYRSYYYQIDQIEEVTQEELLTQDDPRFQALAVSKKQQALVAFKNRLKNGQGEIESAFNTLNGLIYKRTKIEMQSGCGSEAKQAWIAWQKEREARWTEYVERLDELSKEILGSLEKDLDIR